MDTTLYVNESLRYQVRYDEGHWQLDDFILDDVGVVEFGRSLRSYDFDRGEFYYELRELISRFHDTAQQMKAVRLYLTLAGVAFVERRIVGYSQGDVRDVIVYSARADEAALVENVEILKAWLFGDLFYITEEKLEAWQSVASGEIEYRWEEAESLGGFMFYGDYTPEKAILDSFGQVVVGDRVEAAR